MKPGDRVRVVKPPATNWGTPVGTEGTVLRVLGRQGPEFLVEVKIGGHFDTTKFYIPIERLEVVQ